MILYHGTSERNLKAILQFGILAPDFTGESNWDHTVKANPGCVYLTDVYAGYFAAGSAKDGERWAIIEVDTDMLCEFNFRPDEDVIAQSLVHECKGQDDSHLGSWCSVIKGLSLIEVTGLVRDHIDDWADLWQESLRVMGTCCYKGKIPVKAIRRVGLYDPDSNSQITLDAYDPAITPLNYRFCKDKYAALTKWLMGETITPEEYMGFRLDAVSADLINLDKLKETLANQKIETI